MMKAWAGLVLAAAAGWTAATIFQAPAKSAEPRLSQLTMTGLNEAQRPLGESVMKVSSVGLGGPYNVMLRSPEPAKHMLALMDYLRWRSSVPLRLNEFAILIQARLWRSQVEWLAHYPIAMRAGLSESIAADLKANRRPAGMQADDAAVYDFCLELYTKHEVSDANWARLRAIFSEQQIVDLMLVSGTYINLAGLMAGAEQGVPPGREMPFKPGEP